ncbi:hypothetical protein NBRC3280_1866 [Acetobacter pasteurianus NBRC 3280]|uniref:Uncharacterized protein n=1 Tax=Acetobacter pasteurianus NBRC 3278 TaxID=1226660 RepID=A0A401X4N9_ACEPA|nr:hypothetical protein NBRC3277_1928 [Acetobacter pasteurianus NBRC 3277]GCD62860.1 hypothetical protein NBRC3278_1953 [Acetobacter pasteurianus NBRC 3278]GCD69231.1 hypothetical protein NBRC3280_1866 [Acetobacter pasteurianus NBRC 3280]
MPANQIVLFASGTGANTYAPAVWSTRPEVSFGYQVGIADATSVNTALRQASFVAAMIGQYTADLSGKDTLDNGDIPTFENNFKSALSNTFKSQLAASSPYLYFMGQI